MTLAPASCPTSNSIIEEHCLLSQGLDQFCVYQDNPRIKDFLHRPVILRGLWQIDATSSKLVNQMAQLGIFIYWVWSTQNVPLQPKQIKLPKEREWYNNPESICLEGGCAKYTPLG